MVKQSVSTAVQVRGGRIVWANRDGFLRAVRRMKDCDAELVIAEATRKRTNPQNAYLHAVCFPLMAEFFGQSIDETKRDLMGECWGWAPSPISGREVPIRSHTSEMTVEECQFFIDWLIPWAATKWEIAIPLPNEVAA